MSIQSQAILNGHAHPEEVMAMLQAVTCCAAILKSSHRDTYKTIEIVCPAGVETVHLFLDSSVAEDYRGVTEEPSTLITVQFSPFASDMVRRFIALRGGYFRRTEHEAWAKIDKETARPPLSA